MKKIWTVWKFTIGSFSDERTKEHDNTIAIIRTTIVGINVLTCLIIIANIHIKIVIYDFATQLNVTYYLK